MSLTAGELGLIGTIVNLILGVGVVGYFKYKLSIRTADRTDFDSITGELKEQRDQAFARVAEQDQRIDHMEAEIQGLRIARDLDPFPNWIVDLSGILTFVNRPFEQHFLEPEGKTYRDVVGRPLGDMFPEKFCQQLKTLDAAARTRPDGIARANTTLEVPSSGPSQVTVHKLPVRVRGVIVCNAGYITAIDPEAEKLGWQDTNKPPTTLR